ncbi:MAG TPA: B12-binding domain-containing radical SAM protein, partial [Spirochaetia bacterium]|nr:B12-binding domain-containing radical SAM protein [Spirochaetia bacterium]
FIFGYPHDTSESLEHTYRFSQEQRFFFTAFNHLVPFPGTDLYAELERSGKLLYRKWWLEPGYRFGDVAFEPERMSAKDLSRACLAYRRKFHSASSLVRRGTNFRANISDMRKFIIFWSQGLTGRGDVERRQGLPLGEME